jgi:predicted transposase/invertase (TIGR01784 family)
MSEYKYEVDTQSKVVQAKREGRKEGLLEGRKEGRQEGIREIAHNLKAMGELPEKIAALTGLSREVIESL